MNYFQKSRQKLIHAVIAMIVFAIHIVWQVKDQSVDPPLWITMIGGIAFLYCIIISCLGFINGIQSYRHHEPYNYKRALVMLGNFCFFGTLLLLVLANLFDILRAF